MYVYVQSPKPLKPVRTLKLINVPCICRKITLNLYLCVYVCVYEAPRGFAMPLEATGTFTKAENPCGI